MSSTPSPRAGGESEFDASDKVGAALARDAEEYKVNPIQFTHMLVSLTKDQVEVSRAHMPRIDGGPELVAEVEAVIYKFETQNEAVTKFIIHHAVCGALEKFCASLRMCQIFMNKVRSARIARGSVAADAPQFK